MAVGCDRVGAAMGLGGTACGAFGVVAGTSVEVPASVAAVRPAVFGSTA